MTQALSGEVGALHIKELETTDFDYRLWEAARTRRTSPTSSALSEGALEGCVVRVNIKVCGEGTSSGVVVLEVGEKMALTWFCPSFLSLMPRPRTCTHPQRVCCRC